MKNALLRGGFLALSLTLLLSCGGGGGSGPGLSLAGSSAIGTGGFLTDPDAGSAGPGGASDGGAAGTASAGGDSGAATTASSGDGSSNGAGGVGSGGTGATSASAAGVGAADGAGSIFVNGLRYNTDSAALNIEDAPGLQLGMSVAVSGPVNADFTSGVANLITSAAEMRGPLTSVDPASASLVVMGTTVSTDPSTVWADSAGLASLVPGRTLQVWGLPAGPGVLLATRVEQRAPATPIMTGTVQNLDTGARTFTLGGISVNYGAAVLSGSIDGRPLANGTIVRVRANSQPSAGTLMATLVQWWYPVGLGNGMPAQFGGVVTDFAGLGSLRVLGISVDASAAQVTGGLPGSVGNGVRVEVGGVFSNGVLKATKFKIRHVPGTGGPSSFTLIGTVGTFSSPASFRVRGQLVNASGPGVVFVNGTAASLGNGAKVTVVGAQVVNGVLLAASVTFN